MNRIKVLFGILIALLLFEIGLSGFLGLVFYQATPNSVLARQTIIGRIPGVLGGIRVLDRTFNIFYWGSSVPEELPQYAISVAPADLQKIEEVLPKNVPSPWYGNVFLTDDAKIWVDGVFHAHGKEYAIKMRVRGDLFNHWAYRKKSWRVKFMDELFDGKKEINLIIPEDRGWIAESLNAWRAKQFGFLQPPMQFVTVSLNGSSTMIYTEVEHWTKEMLEKQGRVGDVTIYGADGGTSYFQQWDDVFADSAYWNTYEERLAGAHASFEDIELLRSLSEHDAHLRPKYHETVETLFDVDLLTKWYVLSLLSGSRHVRDHNARFFFDTSKGKLEPVPWDISLYAPQTLLALPGNPFLNELFRVPEWKYRAYVFLWNYINDEERVNEDFAYAQKLRSLVERPAYRDPVKLPSNRTVKKELDIAMRNIRANIDFLKQELSLSEILVHQRIPSKEQEERGLLATIEGTVRGISPVHFAGFYGADDLADAIERGEVRLLRDNGDNVWDNDDASVPLALGEKTDKKNRREIRTTDEFLSLMAPGDPLIGEDEIIKGAPHTRYTFFLVRIRGDAALTDADFPLNLRMRNAVTGEKADILNEILIDDRTFEHLHAAYRSREDFLSRYPMFTAGEEGSVFLRGTQTFFEHVIVPSTVSRLRILPGTTVRMGSGVTLLSYAPVSVAGTEGSPVSFERATTHPWGSFLVANANLPSEVRWAEFSGGGETFLNGIFASGMVAFHASPVTIRDSTFTDSHGDDALNIKYVSADLVRLHFENSYADALDIDSASSGVLEDSTFVISGDGFDSNGDGVDISWSNIEIRNIQIDGFGDKCISVGESSTLVIVSVTLKRCHYGIAVKDASHVLVKDASFIGNDIAIGAYVKKSIFDPPSIMVEDSQFEETGVREEEENGATITIEP